MYHQTSNENEIQKQIKFFTSRLKTAKEKFKLWQYIDYLYLQSEFKKLASDPVVQIAGELRGLLQQNTEQWASEVVLQSQFASSSIHNENLH